MRAIRCDIDHTHAYAHGGLTDVRNLAHLCTRHPTLKHATPWASPLGHTYTNHPPTLRAAGVRFDPHPDRSPKDGPPGVRFIPNGDPPPF
jgi:hypothetical protein